MIPDKISHIDWYPSKMESFYVTTNTEPQPQPVGEEMGVVIYNYQPRLSVDYVSLEFWALLMETYQRFCKFLKNCSFAIPE